MAGVKTEEVTLHVADGTTMKAYLATPEAGTKGKAILVFQEAFGVNAHVRDITERFAGEGYVALAPELFHRTAPGFQGAYDNFPAVAPHLQALTPDGLASDSKAAFSWLQSHPDVMPDSIACIGFCMGGRTSFVANSVVPLKAAISFYGGGIAPALLPRAADQHAPLLFFWGGLDKHIPPEQIQSVIGALREAGKSFVNIEISYADHGFFCDARPSYSKTAAKLAWPIVLNFLEMHL